LSSRCAFLRVCPRQWSPCTASSQLHDFALVPGIHSSICLPNDSQGALEDAGIDEVIVYCVNDGAVMMGCG
jgi:hypothetical protein